MATEERPDTSIESLNEMLASKDGLLRQKARESLVALGTPAVPSLVHALGHSKSDQVRWEAAKALGAIGDPSSIPALVDALSDRDGDVAWVAAEALRTFKMAAWPALLRALINSGPDAVSFREGCHHVLRDQTAKGFDDLLPTLIKDLEFGAMSESAVVVAEEILERLTPGS